MSKVYYLAGPMQGYEKFNFPAFHRAAAVLRKRGLTIISPAEEDSEAVKAAAMKSKDGKLDKDGKIAGETWGDILAKDVKLIADKIDGIIFMDGWEKSNGANLEGIVGLLVATKRVERKQPPFEFYRYHNDTEDHVPLSKFTVLWSIGKALEDKLKLLR